jgi:hypothetical protein
VGEYRDASLTGYATINGDLLKRPFGWFYSANTEFSFFLLISLKSKAFLFKSSFQQSDQKMVIPY